MTGYPELRRRAERARAAGVPAAFRGTARRALIAWIDAAATHGLDPREAMLQLRDGAAAIEAGRAALEGQIADPAGPMAKAGCAMGCAFCCILKGDDGGTISGAEARRLHAALAPLAGSPDGRAWHPDACPALDPKTRTCRAYDARPMICRSYISPDAALCEQLAKGEPVAGPGVLGGHGLYLSVLALTRETLKGITAVPTHSMAGIAASAVAGETIEAALAATKHAPRGLSDEIARHRAALKG